MYYTRRIDFDDFADLVGVVFIIAVIACGLIAGFGSCVVYDAQQNQIAEQNLYFALQGKEVNDTKVMRTAEMLRQLYENKFQNWTQFKEIDLGIAFKHWDNVLAILENPEKEINVDIFTWEEWLSIAGIISWLIIALSLSATYPVATWRERYSFNERGFNRWWQYPWRKWWAHPILLVMLPYVIITQPTVSIYAAIRKAKGIDKREALEEYFRGTIPPKRTRLEEEIERDKANFQSLVNLVDRDREANRRKWIEISKKKLSLEKQKTESTIKSRRTDLSSLGRQIETAQRGLAEAEAKLTNLNEAIEMKKDETGRELGAEFDQLLGFPLVKAVKVEDNEIKVYTDTIYISRRWKKYEIGNFLICIGTRENGYILIRNLSNTSSCGQHHPYTMGLDGFCFGNLRDQIDKLLIQRDYLTLIVVILQALQTAEGDASDRVEYWKEVKD